MLSVTSYSKPQEGAAAPAPAPQRKLAGNGLLHVGLLKKNMARFWPLWALYAVVLLLCWPVMQALSLYTPHFSNSAPAERVLAVATDMLHLSVPFGLWGGLFGGLFFAMAMFSYLSNGRALSMFHSFPIRRETLFFTNYVSGLLCFVPAAVLAAILSALAQMGTSSPHWYAIGMSLLAVVGQTFFFYSFAVLCAMFTGQLLAVAVFYGIFNCLVLVMNSLVQAFAQRAFFGYAYGSAAWLRWLTPVINFQSHLNVEGGRYWMGGTTPLALKGLSALAVYAVVAVVLTAVSLVIYRRRRSETAGDIVVLDWAKVVFRFGVGVCAALSLGQGAYYLLWEAFFYSRELNLPVMVLFCIIAGVLGYYGAEMFIRKSFRVLRKGLRGAAVLSAGLVLCGAAAGFDLLGIENRLPNESQVVDADLRVSYPSGFSATLHSPEGVALVRELHQAVLAEKETFRQRAKGGSIDSDWIDSDNNNCNIYIGYTLKDGSYMQRRYDLYYPLSEIEGTGAMAKLAATISDPLVQHGSLDITSLERFTGGTLEMYTPGEDGWQTEYVSISAEQAQTLYDAIQRDIDEGNFAKNHLNSERYRQDSYVNNFTLNFLSTNDAQKSSGDRNQHNYNLNFSKNATHLLAAMEELGLLEKGALRTMEEWEDGPAVDGTYPNTYSSGVIAKDVVVEKTF